MLIFSSTCVIGGGPMGSWDADLGICGALMSLVKLA